MKFEFSYHECHFDLKYYDTLHTYNIRFSLSCNRVVFFPAKLLFCPFNNRFAFYNNFPMRVSDDFVKGIKENKKEFDLYIKKIKFQTSPFFIGV